MAVTYSRRRLHKVTYVTLIGRTLYGFYGWLVFCVCALFALIFTIVVPFADLRHRLTAADGTAGERAMALVQEDRLIRLTKGPWGIATPLGCPVEPEV